MTILVTGGAGYIGSHMAHALHDAGEKFVILDNLSTGIASSIPQGASFVQGDVGDEKLVASIIASHNVQSIMHFAASIVVSDSVADPLSYYRNNSVNTRSLIETAIKGGVKNFIFSSTAAVYGTPRTLPVQESALLLPESPYGSSKLMSEIMLRDASRAFGLNYVILRYFNVAGADPKGRVGQSTPAATHLVKVAVQAVLKLRAGLEIFGTDYPTPDGTCIRDYIHVSDLVAAHSAALAHLRSGGKSLTANCGYGHGYSVLEVVEAVKRVSGVDFPVKLSPRRAGDPAGIVADNSLIMRELAWKPAYADLSVIVDHALAWEKKITAS